MVLIVAVMDVHGDGGKGWTTLHMHGAPRQPPGGQGRKVSHHRLQTAGSSLREAAARHLGPRIGCACPPVQPLPWLADILCTFSALWAGRSVSTGTTSVPLSPKHWLSGQGRTTRHVSTWGSPGDRAREPVPGEKPSRRLLGDAPGRASFPCRRWTWGLGASRAGVLAGIT